jgi:hypothetical protein
MERDVEGSGPTIFRANVLIFAGNVEECHEKYQSWHATDGSRIESETFSIQRYNGNHSFLKYRHSNSKLPKYVCVCLCFAADINISTNFLIGIDFQAFTAGVAATVSFCVTGYTVWDHTLIQTVNRNLLPVSSGWLNYIQETILGKWPTWRTISLLCTYFYF